jgi:hypothetical protein
MLTPVQPPNQPVSTIALQTRMQGYVQVGATRQTLVGLLLLGEPRRLRPVVLVLVLVLVLAMVYVDQHQLVSRIKHER